MTRNGPNLKWLRIVGKNHVETVLSDKAKGSCDIEYAGWIWTVPVCGDAGREVVSLPVVELPGKPFSPRMEALPLLQTYLCSFFTYWISDIAVMSKYRCEELKRKRGQQNSSVNGEMEGKTELQFATHRRSEEGTGLSICTALFHSSFHNFRKQLSACSNSSSFCGGH